ncbi:MAG: Fur family transcriptional regulator [Dehalococcoidia bacterium]|nr:Fur family transcriptional regulator [Dehalococcoidia bacterium]
MAITGGIKNTVDTLRQRGLRLTPQRKIVFSVLESSEGHLSAEEIYSRVQAKSPKINISTVYRNLETLKQLGLITVTDLGEGRLRYHYGEKGHHHHLICEKCGAVLELDESLLRPLKKELRRQYDFEADLSHLAIFGRCQKCR